MPLLIYKRVIYKQGYLFLPPHCKGMTSQQDDCPFVILILDQHNYEDAGTTPTDVRYT